LQVNRSFFKTSPSFSPSPSFLSDPESPSIFFASFLNRFAPVPRVVFDSHPFKGFCSLFPFFSFHLRGSFYRFHSCVRPVDARPAPRTDFHVAEPLTRGSPKTPFLSTFLLGQVAANSCSLRNRRIFRFDKECPRSFFHSPLQIKTLSPSDSAVLTAVRLLISRD